MPSSHDLAKTTWTDSDFDVMGWHDSRLYGFTVLPESFEFVFDIDYIVKWVKPEPADQYFSFWVAPATLVFRDAQNIVVAIEMGPLVELEILAITRTPIEGKPGDWRWLIDLTSGEIRFDSTGYSQYIRKLPVFSSSQCLDLEERGDLSYSRASYRA
jgi:hypothetical protein